MLDGMRRVLLWLAASIVFACTAPPPVTNVTLGSLTPGACFSGWDPSVDTGTPKEAPVRVIDCAQPHESEYMFWTRYLSGVSVPTDLFGPGLYPGLAELEADAAVRCSIGFADYVGIDASQSVLRLSFVVPDEIEWDKGALETPCIATFPNGPATGSVRGTQR